MDMYDKHFDPLIGLGENKLSIANVLKYEIDNNGIEGLMNMINKIW
jgi:hypothetical protein